jgi:hypothetical protein
VNAILASGMIDAAAPARVELHQRHCATALLTQINLTGRCRPTLAR